MDREEEQAFWARRAEVQADLERLQAAAEDLPDLWTGIEVDEADIVVVTTDPERAAAHLLPLIEHRDRVRFEAARYTKRDLERVHRQTIALIDALHRVDVWSVHGVGHDAAHISLRSTESTLAHQLHERFGDMIRISLGAHRYPIDTDAPRPVRPPPAATLHLPHLVLTAELDDDTVQSGDRVHGHVRAHNSGPTAIRLDTGSPARAVVLDQQGDVVAAYIGVIFGVGRILELPPGCDGTVGFVGGTDAVDPAVGPALPPGSYQVVVPLPVTVDGEAGVHGVLVTRPTSLRVTARSS